MDNWSEAKKECYYDFVEQMLKDGYIVKKRKKSVPKDNWCIEAFESTYKAYPRKASKPQALKAWNALKPSHELIDKISGHSSKAYENVEKIYIPHFSTYLNHAKYNDEIVVKEKELLKLTAENEKLWEFAKEHDLGNPRSGEDFFQYRARLNGIIQERQLYKI